MQDRIIFHYISCTGINRQTRRQSDLGEAHIWRVDGHASCHADHIQLLRLVGTFSYIEKLKEAYVRLPIYTDERKCRRQKNRVEMKRITCV